MGRDAIARALLLGGSGFLGSHVLEALLEHGYAVRVFTRRSDGVPLADRPDVEYMAGDFGNRGDLTAALEGCEIVFHLVATTVPKTSNDDPVHDLESNLLSTVRFLDLARQHRIRKVVFASSGGTVYGEPETIPIPEHHPTRPICSYGIHKRAVEDYLRLYHRLYGLDYCVLRVSNAFGERQRPTASQGAVGAFLATAIQGDTITIWGDGSVVRDYIYAKDAARAFALAGLHNGPHRVFNIGSGHGLSVNELIASIETLLGHNVSLRYLPGRPFDVPVSVLDVSLATTHLGWSPRFTFQEALCRTFTWLQCTLPAQSQRVETPTPTL